MMTRILTAGLTTIAFAMPLAAGAQSADPLMDGVKNQYGIVKGYLAKTAEQVPEDVYAFKPTPAVRSFGELLGHIADAQFAMCSAATGDKAPRSGIEKSVTAKAELVKALAESTAYCDKQMASMDDKKGVELVKFFGGQQPRAMVFSFNTAHDFEHYGNLVTYMRLKNITPPSSQGKD